MVEQNKKKFLRSHRLRGFTLLLLAYFLCYFILYPTFAKIILTTATKISGNTNFDFFHAYSSLSSFNQLIFILSLAVILVVLCPFVTKLIRSYKYFSGLHGVTIGVFIAFTTYFFEHIVKFATTSYFFEYIIAFVTTFCFFSYLILFTGFCCLCLLFNSYVLEKKGKDNYSVQDNLNYSDLVIQIKEYILSKNTSKENKIAILYGRNGLGKTHSLKLLEKELLQENLDNKSNVSVYYFYPSHYTIDTMTDEFYSLLEKALTKKYYLPNMSFYSKTFAYFMNVIETKTRTSGFFRNLFINLLFGESKKISEILTYYYDEVTNVVLFIDETDRCSIEQIEAFVAIIRNLGSNIGFRIIITFTHEVEHAYREKCNKNSSESTFEKVAKNYYELPSHTTERVQNYWKKISTEETANISPSEITPLIAELLSTPRLLQLFQSNLLSFNNQYKAFKTHGTQILTFILAVLTSSPSTYSKIAYLYMKLVAIKANERERNLKKSGLEKMSELVKNSLIKERILSEDVLTIYWSEIEKNLQAIISDLDSFYLKFIFMRMTPHSKLLETSISNPEEYIALFDKESEALEINRSSTEKRPLYMTVGYKLSLSYQGNQKAVLDFLKHILNTNNSQYLFASIFKELYAPLHQEIFILLQEEVSPLMVYDGLWKTEHQYVFTVLFWNLPPEEIYKIILIYFNNKQLLTVQQIMNEYFYFSSQIQEKLIEIQNDENLPELSKFAKFLFHERIRTSEINDSQAKAIEAIQPFLALTSYINVQEYIEIVSDLIDKSTTYYSSNFALISALYDNNFANCSFVYNYFVINVIAQVYRERSAQLITAQCLEIKKLITDLDENIEPLEEKIYFEAWIIEYKKLVRQLKKDFNC